MKNRIGTIGIPLAVGIAIGLLISPSLWKGIGKNLSETATRNKQILATAMTAMQGKKVFLQSEDSLAAAAANELVSLGASYAPREKADFLISIVRKNKLGWPDLDIRDRNGKLLHKVSVSEKAVAKHEVIMFAWSLAKHSS